MFQVFDRALLNLTSALVAGLTALMAGVVLLGVFTRYVLNDPLPWTEEAARYALLWLSWLGGGLALRRGAHIAVEFLLEAIPSAATRAVLLFAGRFAAIFFLAICVWYGLVLVQRVSFQSTIALGISMQLPYASVPVGSILMIYHMLVVMLGPRDTSARDAELGV
jgi:TRAP-type C4-dicarboxylate transport system permease small subunit